MLKGHADVFDERLGEGLLLGLLVLLEDLAVLAEDGLLDLCDVGIGQVLQLLRAGNRRYLGCGKQSSLHNILERYLLLFICGCSYKVRGCTMPAK